MCANCNFQARLKAWFKNVLKRKSTSLACAEVHLKSLVIRLKGLNVTFKISVTWVTWKQRPSSVVLNINSHQVIKRVPHGDRHFKIPFRSEKNSKIIMGPLKFKTHQFSGNAYPHGGIALLLGEN